MRTISETPILGSRIAQRRETLKALEHRRDDVLSERKQQSRMRTLGASNPHNNNKDKHRTAPRLTGANTVGQVFANGGIDNAGFDPNSAGAGGNSSNTDDEASSSAAGRVGGGGGLRFNDRGSSDLQSTSAASKM